MAVSVKVIGVDKIERKLLAIAKGVPVELVDAMNKAAAVVNSHAKMIVPIRTGDLRGSIHTKPAEISGQTVTSGVATSKEYAAYVEFGTGVYSTNPSQSTWQDGSYHTIPINGGKEFRKVKGTHAYPFLHPALKQNRNRINSLISGAVHTAIKRSI